MNKQMPTVLISGDNLELTDALKQTAQEKMQKLFHHENHIVRIRVELGHSPNLSKNKEFFARGHITIRGPDLVATVDDNDLYSAIDGLENKLARMLRRRSRLRRVKRKQTHEVDVPAFLPKVATA